jgi:hypothetical protein
MYKDSKFLKEINKDALCDRHKERYRKEIEMLEKMKR